MKRRLPLKLLFLLACTIVNGCSSNQAKVKLELFLVNLVQGETIAYGRRFAHLSRDTGDPDTVARNLVASGCNPAILHSTSWRWEKNGTIILTYLAFSEDPKCLAAEPLRLSCNELIPPQSTDPTKPRPTVIRQQDVLSHGIRHLTFLVRYSRDRRIAEVLSPESRQFFLRMCAQLAGRFDSAAELADCSDAATQSQSQPDTRAYSTSSLPGPRTARRRAPAGERPQASTRGY